MLSAVTPTTRLSRCSTPSTTTSSRDIQRGIQDEKKLLPMLQVIYRTGETRDIYFGKDYMSGERNDQHRKWLPRQIKEKKEEYPR